MSSSRSGCAGRRRALQRRAASAFPHTPSGPNPTVPPFAMTSVETGQTEAVGGTSTVDDGASANLSRDGPELAMKWFGVVVACVLLGLAGLAVGAAAMLGVDQAPPSMSTPSGAAVADI